MSAPGPIVMLGCDPRAPGGISTVLQHYQASTLMDRWPIRMVSTWRHPHVASRLASAAQAASELWPLVATGRLQAVHAHVAARGSFWRKWALLQPVWAAGVPVVLHVHDGTFVQWWMQRPRNLRHEITRTLERSTRVLALDEAWKAELEGIAPRARVTVLPNPVGAPIPRGHPVPGRLLFLSRLWPSKGIDDLLEAAARLRQPFELVCVGDGDLQRVMHRAHLLGIGSRVHLRGWLTGRDKQQELSRAQLMVMPSHAEGQPMAALEAMAAGVPVVASAVGGLPRLLGNGAGVLVPPRHPQALAVALDELLADPDRCRMMGQTGRDQVQRHHAPESVVARLSALYSELGLREPHRDRPHTGPVS